MRTLSVAALLLIAATPATKPVTPADIVASAPRSAWRPIPADELLVIDLKSGARVIIQLAPAFAPVHVANIRALGRAQWWDGAAIYRVQDDYVVQWGHNDERKVPAGVIAKPPAEYERPLTGLAIRTFPYRDSYAPRTGHVAGWPVSIDHGQASLTHCYGTVGVGRDLAPDTGTGGELYTVIGHGPRQLDRNIAIVGRVIAGIEAFSSLPRGTEALGFYKERSSDVPIAATRLASDIPLGERPAFEVMETGSASFAAYLAKRANRQDAFYQRAAGGVDICNAPVPVRPVKP